MEDRCLFAGNHHVLLETVSNCAQLIFSNSQTGIDEPPPRPPNPPPPLPPLKPALAPVPRPPLDPPRKDII